MSEWLIQESLKRDKIIWRLKLWLFFQIVAFAILSLILIWGVRAQDADPSRVKCTTVGGDVHLGTERVTVPMKCCPRDFYVADPAHPTDNKGNLICTRET